MATTSPELFSQMSSSCRRANEALSQAEQLSGQFALILRRGNSAFLSAKQQQLDHQQQQQQQQTPDGDGEAVMTKIDDAVRRCTEHCAECRRSPLWEATMEMLQTLSPLQRQRLESTRHEVGDVEKQLRVLTNRHQQNVAKFRNYSSSAATSSSSSSSAPNHVSSVLSAAAQQQNRVVAAEQQYSQQEDLARAEQDHRSKERESIQRVTTGVRQLVTESNAVLGALRQQRARMQDTDSRLGQVLSAAGVAQSVVKQLERMTFLDRVIVFGGMFVISVFMLYLWFFV